MRVIVFLEFSLSIWIYIQVCESFSMDSGEKLGVSLILGSCMGPLQYMSGFQVLLNVVGASKANGKEIAKIGLLAIMLYSNLTICS